MYFCVTDWTRVTGGARELKQALVKKAVSKLGHVLMSAREAALARLAEMA